MSDCVSMDEVYCPEIKSNCKQKLDLSHPYPKRDDVVMPESSFGRGKIKGGRKRVFKNAWKNEFFWKYCWRCKHFHERKN